MDWTKAKTILIVALLITNAFLILLYNIIGFDQGGNESELLIDTVKLLENKGIHIKGKLPEEHPKMPVLIIEYDNMSAEEIELLISGQIAKSENDDKIKTAEEISESFLKENNLWDLGIALIGVEYNGEETVLNYQNQFQGMIIEGSSMTCTVKNGVVSKIDRFWLKPVGLGKSKKATISASAALINLMRSKSEGESITVEKIEMVYWLDPSLYGGAAITDTALPSWKITYNDNKIKLFSAYSD